MLVSDLGVGSVVIINIDTRGSQGTCKLDLRNVTCTYGCKRIVVMLLSAHFREGNYVVETSHGAFAIWDRYVGEKIDDWFAHVVKNTSRKLFVS